MALLSVLHYLVHRARSSKQARKGKVTRTKSIGTKPFNHAGHSYVVQFKAIDGYNVELIGDFCEQKNHAQARISALHNSIMKLERDGKEIDLEIRSDGGTNIPADYDPDAPKNRKFLKDVLLWLLVNEYQPFLADAFEPSFGKFFEEKKEDENPTSTGSVSEISSSSRTEASAG